MRNYYRLKKWYPSLLVEWREGDVFAPRDISPYYYNTRVPSNSVVRKEDVENNPDYWELIEEKSCRTECLIDNVTVENLNIALRVFGIQLNVNVIDKIIDLVELIEKKGDSTSIGDIASLHNEWSKHSRIFNAE